MELVIGKLIKWIIAIVVLLIIVLFIVAQLKTGGGGPIDAILNFGKNQPPPTP